MRLVLGIPTAGTPTQPFLDSLAKVALPPSIDQLEPIVVTGNYVPAQRDLIAERALTSGAQYALMCDDDIVLPRLAFVDLCAELDRHQRVALAGALYYSRDGFRPMAVDRWDEADTTSALVPGFECEPVAVDGVGFGCVAIRIEALRELTPPYFPANVFVERAAQRVRICNEDYLFCARLRQAGWRVLLVPAVRCGHYDRQLKTIAPAQWEPPEITRSPRMAVLVDGMPKLIEAHAGHETTREAHVRASLDYIIVE